MAILIFISHPFKPKLFRKHVTQYNSHAMHQVCVLWINLLFFKHPIKQRKLANRFGVSFFGNIFWPI